jgi:hypothetical protein
MFADGQRKNMIRWSAAKVYRLKLQQLIEFQTGALNDVIPLYTRLI